MRTPTHSSKSRAMTSYFGLLLFAMAALFVSAPTFAQQAGDIAGTVIDGSDGSAIEGVNVEATSPVLPGKRTATTNAEGLYRLPLLPPGEYTLVYTLPDGSQRLRSAQVLLQQRSTVDLTIGGEDAATLEEVLVVGTSPLLATEDASLSDALNYETFDSLPVGQQYRDLIKLIPGVQYTQDSIRGPSSGGHGQDNTYQFDGVDVSLPMFGTLSAEPSTHDIDQVSMVRGGASAVGFNRSGGFKINTISKRGTDEFHGEASYQIEDSDWSADPDTGVASSDLTRDWIVANLSGPILKDQLYFYASYYNPTTDRTNRDNAYGPVPDYSYDRKEYFGKLTWAPTDSLLFDASYRDSDAEGRGESVGTYETSDGSTGSDATLRIAILEGSWVINENSSAYFKYTDFENKTSGGPDLLLSAQPSIGGSLDLNNLDRMGHFIVPQYREGDDAWNAWAQPLINQYGYVGEDGTLQGGGLVGAAQTINDQDFFRESFEVGYDYTLDFGSVSHELHVGYHQEEIKEVLVRSSNGWGLIESVGGDETTADGAPIYYRANFFQTSLGEYGIPPINSYAESRNIELNDIITWNDFEFNVGVMFSEDTLYGQGLREVDGNLSGYENAPGNKYEMKKVGFDEMIQPRLGVTWHFADNASVFANYARYYPSASSLARAASWDRNLHTEIEAAFDMDGNMIAIEEDASSSGKLFQDGIDPRHVDEFLIGVTWQPTDNLTTRMHYRRREARDFWEDTWNWAREGYSCTAEPDRFGCMPAGWSEEAPYIPELDDYRAEIGGSSFVIAQVPNAYTDYDEISLEAEWTQGNWYLQASYTWSDYRGNFDQDNATSENDFNTFIGSSLLSDGRGRMLWNMKDGQLRGDRTHLFKAYGYYQFSWNGSVGAYALYQSGQPWETWDGSLYGYSSDTIRFAEPAGTHRSDAHYQLDLNYTQNFFFGANDRYGVQLRADLYNVFDNQTGYNIQPSINSAGYGEARSYYLPRRLQLMAKFLF